MRIIKAIFSAIVVVFISLFMFGFEDAYASEAEFSLFSNDLFDEYAEQHLADALELFDEEFQQDNAVERNRIDDIILLPPHIIYHIEEEQNAIYYYPAYDKKSDKIIFIMPVIQIEDALYYEVKGCTDSTYNIISQDYDDYIFYFIGNKLFAENALHTIDFNLGKEILFCDYELSEEERIFADKSYDEKSKLVQSRTEEMIPVLRSNKPDVSDSRRYKTSISLYRPQGYGMQLLVADIQVAEIVEVLRGIR